MYESRHIDGIGSFPTRSEPAPVLALTVVDAHTLCEGQLTESSRVLVVVRRPESNPTHPNVISVPTQRLPRALFRAIVDDTHHLAATADRSLLDGLDSALRSGHEPLVYAAEALLARKLGLADGLEGSDVRFTASIGARVSGEAHYDNLGPLGVSEPIDMVNVVVVLTEGQDLLPEQSSSFSRLLWVSSTSFTEGVSNRDPAAIDPQLDPLDLCVHGLCLSAAETTITTLLGDRARSPVASSHHAS